MLEKIQEQSQVGNFERVIYMADKLIYENKNGLDTLEATELKSIALINLEKQGMKGKLAEAKDIYLDKI